MITAPDSSSSAICVAYDEHNAADPCYYDTMQIGKRYRSYLFIYFIIYSYMIQTYLTYAEAMWVEKLAPTMVTAEN